MVRRSKTNRKMSFTDRLHWYDHAHHHVGLNGYTPEQVFTGRYREVYAVRQAALDEHYRRHPERFVHGPPKAALPPATVAINPWTPDELQQAKAPAAVNFPTLPLVEAKTMLSR